MRGAGASRLSRWRRPGEDSSPGGEDGAAAFWVAYADLMAGIFLVFLLMLVTALHFNSRAQQRIRDDMKKNLAEQEVKLVRINRMTDEISRLKVALAGGQDAISEFLKDQRERSDTIRSLRERIKDLEAAKSELEANRSSLEGSVKARDIDLSRLNERISQIIEETSKVRTLFGVRRDIVESLKSAFASEGGLELKVDPVSGAIELGGGILFDEASSAIRDESREKLESFVKTYLRVLLDNPEVRSHLAQIVIEGHTNDNGTYLRNLRLSQERSHAVMDYLLTLDTPYIRFLEMYVVASGRSFSEPILDPAGGVDKIRSRRIEFKFRLKDEEAVGSLGKVLFEGDAGKQPQPVHPEGGSDPQGDG